MHARSFSLWVFCLFSFPLVSSLAQVTFQPVAISERAAPGLPADTRLSLIGHLALADDGRVAFTGTITGGGVTATNNQGIWAGLPNDLRLVARTGDPAPGQEPGAVFRFFEAPHIDNARHVGFLALLQGIGLTGALLKADQLFYASLGTESVNVMWLPLSTAHNTSCDYWNGHIINTLAGRVELSGNTIGPTNDIAIVAGSPTNVTIVAQKGSPAPGTTGSFVSFSLDPRSLALAPDGTVAFVATAEMSSGFTGLWYGKAGSLKAAALPGRPAPASLLGAGYSFGATGAGFPSINGLGELAFSCSLAGPGLNSTNSDFIVAGLPEALRIIAQSGHATPGIPGAFLSRFGDVLMGADGTVVFSASYSVSGSDYGVWLAPTNGSSLLLFRSGAQAPGAPEGVVFEPSFQFLPPYEQLYINARNQVAFRASLSGPGVNETNRFGIWIAQSDGTVSLVARTGDSIDVGEGVLRPLRNVTFGLEAETVAGPQDGRRSPFNDSGELAILATWQTPPGPPDFGAVRQGLLIARTGLILSAERMADEIRISFPTLNGKQYRVEFSPTLLPDIWESLGTPITGTGRTATVTDTNVFTTDRRYYRAVQTN